MHINDNQEKNDEEKEPKENDNNINNEQIPEEYNDIKVKDNNIET